MPLNLGSTAVSLYLGSQSVNAYLGGTLVTPPVGITLYFNGAVDNDWAELGNWWLDSGHTVAATALPTAADSVVVTAGLYTGPATAATLANLTVNSDEFYGDYVVSGAVVFLGATANFANFTGNATFNDGSSSDGTITGNATFNDSSFNANNGTVGGNATFNDSSFNSGSVTGTATFTGSACNGALGTAGTFVPDPPPSCPE